MPLKNFGRVSSSIFPNENESMEIEDKLLLDPNVTTETAEP
jgi:hypothetical protein